MIRLKLINCITFNTGAFTIFATAFITKLIFATTSHVIATLENNGNITFMFYGVFVC